MKRLVSLILALLMCLAMFSFAGAESELEPATITLYFVSDYPRDTDMVEDALNEMFQRDMNTTIDFQFTTWTDYEQKYDLTLMSGDEVDLIYSAFWMDYSGYANKGAFLELDELLPEYAPNLYASIPQATFDQLKINGHLYAIPSRNVVYGCKGIEYRKDLADLYGLPTPDSIENVEAYLAGIKENEPEMMPMNDCAHYLLLNLEHSMVNEEAETKYGFYAEHDTPNVLVDYWFSDEFVENMKICKKWADMGFWSRSILSDSSDTYAYDSGNSALYVTGMNPSKASGARQTLAGMDPSYDSEYILYATIHGNAWRTSPTGDMTAIPYNSDNPERALMVLDKLCTDINYYRILDYGIEGVHYTLDENGAYTPILDVNGECGYGSNAFDWAMSTPEFAYTSNVDAWYDAKIEECKSYEASTAKFSGKDIAGSFFEDSSEYQTEAAALNNVITQYLKPLEYGLVDDVDAAVAEFREQAKAAGLDKIREGYVAQWTAYCEENGYVG